jgi:hypothetical protein
MELGEETTPAEARAEWAAAVVVVDTLSFKQVLLWLIHQLRTLQAVLQGQLSDQAPERKVPKQALLLVAVVVLLPHMPLPVPVLLELLHIPEAPSNLSQEHESHYSF